MDAGTVNISLIDKHVELTLKDGLAMSSGFVHTIDPVTHNVLLVTKDPKGGSSIEIVLKNAIESVNIVEGKSEDKPDSLPLFVIKTGVEDEVIEKGDRDEVCKWLHRNRLEFKLEGDVIHVEDVQIRPPYRSEDCLSSNLIVLARVQKLLSEGAKHNLL